MAGWGRGTDGPAGADRGAAAPRAREVLPLVREGLSAQREPQTGLCGPVSRWRATTPPAQAYRPPRLPQDGSGQAQEALPPPRPEPVAQTEPIDYCTAAKATAATPFRTSTCRPSGGGPYICIYCSNVPAECTCDTGDGDPGSTSTAPRLCGPRSSRDLIRPGDGDGGRNRPECPRCGPVISERCKVCADRFDRDMREAMRRQSRLADAKDGGVPLKAPPRFFRRLVASAIPSAQPTRPVGTPRTRLRDEPSSSTKPQGSLV